MEELQQKQQASTSDVDRLLLQHQQQAQSKSCLDQSSGDAEELKDVGQCHSIGNMEDSQLVGVPVTLAGDADLMKTDDGRLTNVEVKVDVKVSEISLMKRKRGRPPKGQARTTPPVRKKKDEEDVCFICFDGGSLVLCDRRGCPKAYHPACIKRDEAFFRSRAKWNCGWHICSICQKTSHYMCYTCTYSLCKGCTKDTDYLCVRGSFGFCGTCMRTILLIENSAQGTKEKCEVDFDDKSSWEYLFKVYWMYLKGKLSLTLDELTHAQNPWKGDLVMGPNGESSRLLNHGRGRRFSKPGNSSLYIETSDSKRRKTSDSPNLINNGYSTSLKVSGIDKNETFSESKKWASDELLDFVQHMKNGDTSALSQFDVQTLLLEYIKKNNLRDPLQKCQILCDSRLIKLFGKARLGHIEMLKLLESQFFIREDSSAEKNANLGILDTVAQIGETNGLSTNRLMIGTDKRCKGRRKIDLQVPQNDPNAYAAINSHNIKLIFLSRNQMENFIEDADQFHQKVVGSIVRVKIPNGDQKPDMYRLVQVVGTSKVAQQYNIGMTATDLMLEVINLNKKEVISIDGISNQEFSEDECRCFRQIIKCGLSKCLTVLEIQEKAMAFQAMKVNNLLEAEILRLNHLRDRASEKGLIKELRECLEKLQLLNSPEERQRRLHEIPVVHSDPKMDPSYESDDDDEGDVGKQQENKDDSLRSKSNVFNGEERESISSRSGNYVLNDVRSGVNDIFGTSCHQIGGKSIIENEINPTADGNGDSSSGIAMISKLTSLLAPDNLPLPSLNRIEHSIDDFESDTIWHYQDPTGKTQGPFSLFQLRKWHTAGHFPSDLRVWRTDQKKDDSILLTHVLNGKCHENLSPGQFISLGVTVSTDDALSNSDNRSIDQRLMKSSPQHNGNDESVKSNEWNCHSSGHSKHADFVKANEGQSEGIQSNLDLEKWNVSNHTKTEAWQPLSSTAFTTKFQETTFGQEKGGDRNGIDINSDANDDNQNLLNTYASHSDQGLRQQSDSEDQSGQSSEHNQRHPPVSSFSSCLDSKSAFVSMSNRADQNREMNISDVPSSVAVNSTSDCRDSKSTFASDTKALQPNEIDFFELPSPTPKPSYVGKSQAVENKQSPSSNIPAHDIGHSWSTASSLVGGPVPHTEAAVEWREYSTMPARPSVEEWDSSFASASSLRPAKMMADHAATPSSINCEQTHSPPPQPSCNESNWNAIINEAHEFNSLVDESVSDLLAEVEAMESLVGLDSLTSIMKCGEELTDGSKNDCLNSAEGLSPLPDQGKGDALSSTSDVKLPTHSTVNEETQLGYHADMLHYQRISTPLPTACAQSGEATKKSDTSGRQWQAGPCIPVSVPSTTTWEVTDTTWRLGLDSGNGSWSTAQGNTNVGWSAVREGNSNMNWGVAQGSVHENGSLSSCTTTGNPVVWGNQTRYVNDIFSSPRDRDSHGKDSSYDRGRTTGSRQPFYSMANGGGSHSHRHAPKGQRVCKYYERGCCRKGASCSYWHP